MNERWCSLTQSSCLTCETQNCFYSTANCPKTNQYHKAFWCRTKCLSFFPHPRKEKRKKKPCTFVHETCQPKLKWCINQTVISEILHLFGENFSDVPQCFTLTSLVLQPGYIWGLVCQSLDGAPSRQWVKTHRGLDKHPRITGPWQKCWLVGSKKIKSRRSTVMARQTAQKRRNSLAWKRRR